MRCADGRDVHLQAGMLSHENAGSARVVEMDVREEKMANVSELEATFGEPCLQRGNARRRTAVEERGSVVGVEQVARDDSGRTVVQVDRRRRHD